MNTPPVLLLIFNRTKPLKALFAALRDAKPSKFYIAADGPRDSKPGETELCDSVRSYVLESVDWPCEVYTRFQTQNQGCGRHVSGAITWFFEHEEKGIILEDDCIPHLDFFSYCAVLLDYYKHHDSIYTIGGNNFQTNPVGSSSYYFSAYGHIWGWATWRRAWKNYRFDLNDYDSQFMRKQMKAYFTQLQTFDYWWRVFDTMRTNPVDTWDYQWSFCQWYHNGLSITPKVNLVTNVGYGRDATHTKDFVEGILGKPVASLPVIVHPLQISRNKKADIGTFYSNFERKKRGYFWKKVLEKLRFEIRNRFPSLTC